jgi:DNA-binding SARP family transcriptional activator
VIAVLVLDVVELHRDGERIGVRAGKTTEVLVRLALEAGVMVRTERLIEDLWADEAAGTARNVLQTKVSRLRRALGDSSLVTGSTAGYTLEVDPERGRCAGGASPGRPGLSVSTRRRPVRCFGDVHDGAGDVPG